MNNQTPNKILTGHALFCSVLVAHWYLQYEVGTTEVHIIAYNYNYRGKCHGRSSGYLGSAPSSRFLRALNFGSHLSTVAVCQLLAASRQFLAVFFIFLLSLYISPSFSLLSCTVNLSPLLLLHLFTPSPSLQGNLDVADQVVSFLFLPF